MKKALPYILIGAVVLLAIAAIALYKPKEVFDERVTLSYKEKRPYAAYIFYNSISNFFNVDKPTVLRNSIDKWQDSVQDKGNLWIILTKSFNPNIYELNNIHNFISKGNYVLISSGNFNGKSRDFFNFKLNSSIIANFGEADTSAYVMNKKHYNIKDTSFLNDAYANNDFFELDSTTNKYNVLTRNKNNKPNLIKTRAGEGSIFLSSDPLFFCNYFLLQQNNKNCYQAILSSLPKDVKKIYWDDYYSTKKEDNDFSIDKSSDEPSPFRVLFSYPSFKWAFWLAIALFVIYTLVHLKRRQRFIIEEKPPKNDSLYFAETIGRLYFEKGDNANLAKKMASYLLENIRTKYLINTSNLNNEFVEKLSAKSGYDYNKTIDLVTTINNISNTNSLTQQQLNETYLIFQNFYKHTA